MRRHLSRDIVWGNTPRLWLPVFDFLTRSGPCARVAVHAGSIPSVPARWRRSSAVTERLERICAEASGDQVCSVANFNSPSQAVIAGNTEAVDRAVELLKGVAKRVIKLKVRRRFIVRS